MAKGFPQYQNRAGAMARVRNILRRRMRRRYNARAWAPFGLRNMIAAPRMRGRPSYYSLTRGRVPYSGPLRRDGSF